MDDEMYLRVGGGRSYHKAKWVKCGHKTVLSTVCGFHSVIWNIAWLPHLIYHMPCKRCFPRPNNGVQPTAELVGLQPVAADATIERQPAAADA